MPSPTCRRTHGGGGASGHRAYILQAYILQAYILQARRGTERCDRASRHEGAGLGKAHPHPACECRRGSGSKGVPVEVLAFLDQWRPQQEGMSKGGF